MREDGDTYGKIAKILQVSEITVQKRIAAIKECEESGLGLESLLKKSGRPNLDDSKSTLILQRLVQDDPLLVQKGMREKLASNNIHVSQPTISRKLKKIEITRKRVKRVYVKVTDLRIINERKAFSIRYRNIPNSKLIYLDETGINLHTMQSYGYSPINTNVNILVNPRGKNVSIMTLISNEHVLHYKIIDGSYNSELFKEFIEECITKNVVSNKILLMDNVRFHKTKLIQDLFEENQISFDFIPPYSPQLNPIEEFFSMLKSRYYNKRPIAKTNNEIKSYVKAVFEEIGIDEHLDLDVFYRHMREFIEMAFTGAFF